VYLAVLALVPHLALAVALLNQSVPHIGKEFFIVATGTEKIWVTTRDFVTVVAVMRLKASLTSIILPPVPVIMLPSFALVKTLTASWMHGSFSSAPT